MLINSFANIEWAVEILDKCLKDWGGVDYERDWHVYIS